MQPTTNPACASQLLTVEGVVAPAKALKASNMNEIKTRRSWRDRSRIDLNESHQVRHWTKALGVTQE